ncbi:hypothetical protein J1605_021282 [Eschrichtius robustus]|uniref:Uncharacterized protein n=1 Tax=Eschrichtius robustus TaxID=9764 RepID=A0AB34HJF4_ESCRO|nr:hypothetical protein J1605_021282 [Eschrichtius robustus]
MPRNCSGGGSRAETTVVFPTTARPRGTRLPPPECRDPVTTPCTGRPHAPPREAEPPLRATPPAWCGTRRGRDVNRGGAGLPARHGHVTRTGRSRLVAPATASPTHRVSCFPPEIGPCSPTAQDSQATRPRGDSGGG